MLEEKKGLENLIIPRLAIASPFFKTSLILFSVFLVYLSVLQKNLDP
jgi:hypothetical protein